MKEQHVQDSEALRVLIASQKKNKTTFNQAALAKLGEL